MKMNEGTTRVGQRTEISIKHTVTEDENCKNRFLRKGLTSTHTDK